MDSRIVFAVVVGVGVALISSTAVTEERTTIEQSIQSASIGDKQESSVQEESGRQSSGDGADSQADKSSQTVSQHPEQHEVGQDDNQPSSSTNQKGANPVQTGNVETEPSVVLQKPDEPHQESNMKDQQADKHKLNNIQENQEGSKSESEGQDQQKMDSRIVIAFFVGVGVGVVVGVGVTLLLQSTGVIDAIRQKLRKNSQQQEGLIPGEHFTSKVKVYSVVTGKTFGADQVLLNKLKNVRTTRNLQESHVVIVFCPITSRVGSDVEAAMTDITGSCGQKPVILVLMHHTRDVDYSTDGRSWSDVNVNIVLDVHVLFHETERGLLKCPKNDQAVGQIQRELQELSK